MKTVGLCVAGGLLLLSLVSCAGKGERIDIAIPGKHTAARVSSPPPGTMRVAVLPFEDKRENRAHLGKRDRKSVV